MASIDMYFPQLSLKRSHTPASILASNLLCPFDHELLVRQGQRPVLGRVDVGRWNSSPSGIDHRGAECRDGLLAEQVRILRDQRFGDVVVENIRSLLIEQYVRSLAASARRRFKVTRSASNS